MIHKYRFVVYADREYYGSGKIFRDTEEGNYRNLVEAKKIVDFLKTITSEGDIKRRYNIRIVKYKKCARV